MHRTICEINFIFQNVIKIRIGTKFYNIAFNFAKSERSLAESRVDITRKIVKSIFCENNFVFLYYITKNYETFFGIDVYLYQELCTLEKLETPPFLCQVSAQFSIFKFPADWAYNCISTGIGYIFLICKIRKQEKNVQFEQN